VISFEKSKSNYNEIKKITEEEKNALKAEIEIIDKELASAKIRDELKLKKLRFRAAS
jgi:SMC interacting uncharacterized protein involved in chromosome segregation